MSKASEDISRLCAVHEKPDRKGLSPWQSMVMAMDKDLKVADVPAMHLFSYLCDAKRHFKTSLASKITYRIEYWANVIKEVEARVASFNKISHLTDVDPIQKVKRTPIRVPGQGGAKRTVPFETIQEIRMLHEKHGVQSGQLAQQFGFPKTTVEGWLTYMNRVRK